ncbi:MAG: hypothetical protein KJ623_00625 [Nanoarchaeota archaeon]|nr:hypothetical protein [Nanoarchaeota archaeon]
MNLLAYLIILVDFILSLSDRLSFISFSIVFTLVALANYIVIPLTE